MTSLRTQNQWLDGHSKVNASLQSGPVTVSQRTENQGAGAVELSVSCPECPPSFPSHPAWPTRALLTVFSRRLFLHTPAGSLRC